MLVVQLNMQDLHSGLCKGDVSWCLVGFGKTLQLFCLGNCFQANVEAQLVTSPLFLNDEKSFTAGKAGSGNSFKISAWILAHTWMGS